MEATWRVLEAMFAKSRRVRARRKRGEANFSIRATCCDVKIAGEVCAIASRDLVSFMPRGAFIAVRGSDNSKILWSPRVGADVTNRPARSAGKRTSKQRTECGWSGSKIDSAM